MEEIIAITMPGVHSRFLNYFKEKAEPENLTVLDLGAGHGALTQKLFNMGYKVHACDLFPETFEFNQVECTKVDVTESFPYPDELFDMVVAVEVIEHILDHENFYREINRILKPRGRLYISTPNIHS